ncbi:MAG: transporter [Segetibacter sp.]|nr:transporter [Segetibacter sp.]
MINFVLIGLCIIAGLLFRKYGKLPHDAHKSINAWIIYIALPAVSFKYLPHIQWSSNLLLPVVAPIIVWLGSWVYNRFYAIRSGIHKGTEGGMKLTAGLSNTSFVGFPLIMAYFSESDIGTAIICDQVTFTLLSSAGIIVAINSSKQQELSPGPVIKKILRFPPFLGCIAALFLPHFIDIAPAEPLFDKLASTVGPLALFSIGLQLKFNGWRGEIKHLSVALFYKLLIAPALILLIVLLFNLHSNIARITVFEMAMPTLLTSGVVADEYNLNPKLSNLIIGVGIVVSFVTTAFWFAIIQWLV